MDFINKYDSRTWNRKRNPLQSSRPENPRDRGARGLQRMGHGGGHHHVTGTGHRVTDAAIAATLKQPATKGADALRLCTSRGDAALPGQEAGASPKERESWVTASPGGRVRDTE